MNKFRLFLQLRRNINKVQGPVMKYHSCRCCSSWQPLETEKDIESLFLDERVQNLLTNITGFDIDKISRPFQQKIKAPRYQFLTEEQLREVTREANDRARRRLHMPPFMKERKPIEKVVSKDPELQGRGLSTIVFTDITPGLPNRERTVVVREDNGILRKASWEERERMLQIYFPVEGRYLAIPTMFEDSYLQKVLDDGKYEFVLDRACLQFEPDDPEYLRVTGTTYNHMDKYGKHDVLRSTRHFGPMAFYLVLRCNVDNLLADMISRQLVEDAENLVRLYHLVHPECSSAQTSSQDLLECFVEKDAKKSDKLQLALDALREIQKQKALLDEGIRKAHGMAQAGS